MPIDPPSVAPALVRTRDPRSDPALLDAIARVAPGTALRQGIDDIIRSHEGALLVVGDPVALSPLFSGGIPVDQPFTPQLLYELAKMDGAIVITEDLGRLAYANVQLVPDPAIPSAETGTRHRTAERVARQTGSLVVSISQQRETVTVFVGTLRHQLDPIATVFAKANQALAAVDSYRKRLEQMLTRLTALEFRNGATLEDVLVVLQHAEMTTRMVREVENDCVELGQEGRLIQVQLEGLAGQVPEAKSAVVADYLHSDDPGDVATVCDRLVRIADECLLDSGLLAELLGFPRGVDPLETAVSPRGIRALAHVPRLPGDLIRTVVAELDGLDGIVRASLRELEAVDGVGSVRAREIREGLRRLEEHNLLERNLGV